MTLPQIDPRTVPVTQVDSHLPAVARKRLEADALRSRFAAPPAWQPEFRVEKKFMDREPMPAAVLLPIVLRPEPTVLLTLRTPHLSTHSGQIAFPGGKVDETDADAVAAALRETQEEIGLDAQFVEVLGQLPVYVTGSAFHVTPVVALISPGFALNPNPNEVADIFEVPLAYLMNPAGRAASMAVHALPGPSYRALYLGRHGRHVAQLLPFFASLNRTAAMIHA